MGVFSLVIPRFRSDQVSYQFKSDTLAKLYETQFQILVQHFKIQVWRFWKFAQLDIVTEIQLSTDFRMFTSILFSTMHEITKPDLEWTDQQVLENFFWELYLLNINIIILVTYRILLVKTTKSWRFKHLIQYIIFYQTLTVGSKVFRHQNNYDLLYLVFN